LSYLPHSPVGCHLEGALPGKGARVGGAAEGTGAPPPAPWAPRLSPVMLCGVSNSRDPWKFESRRATSRALPSFAAPLSLVSLDGVRRIGDHASFLHARTPHRARFIRGGEDDEIRDETGRTRGSCRGRPDAGAV